MTDNPDEPRPEQTDREWLGQWLKVIYAEQERQSKSLGWHSTALTIILALVLGTMILGACSYIMSL